tara:strand:+ start:8873 stop:10603 length:1731 start_codon:yes stop_codon:yes gene_type:complete
MSKIQVDEIYDLDGTGAPLLPKGVVVTGVVTATSYSGDGSNLDNITLGTSANANTTGIITASAFSGDGSDLQNVSLPPTASINTTGIITASAFSGDGSGLVFAPKIIAFDPAALSTGAVITTNITITFDQNIYFSGSGTIEIRRDSISGTILESFAITSGTPASGLTISGTQLIINPTSNLTQGATVYVILPSSGIANTEGISYAGSNNYNFQTESTGFTAQGGDLELNLIDPNSPTGYYKYHIFTSSGILTTSQNTANADSFTFMMIGGGGAGNRANASSYNNHGGGGGAGGYIAETGSTIGLVANDYTVTIGAGGVGSNPQQTYGQSGTETTLTSPTYTLIAYGGGRGQGYPNPVTAQTGGSGGGGGGYAPQQPKTGASGITGQGNPGGTSYNNYQTPSDPSYLSVAAGGGGGAGSAGGNGQFYPGPAFPQHYFRPGQGGDGARNPAFNSSVLQPHIQSADIPGDTWITTGPTNDYWAGGGAGGYSPSYGAVQRGGYGGGGNCGPRPTSSYPTTSLPTSPQRGPVPAIPTLNTNIPQNGAFATGGGGGGGEEPSDSGNGGSGVVMIRYAAPASA